MASVKSYQDLRVWQDAMRLAVDVYRLTDTFPNHERYGLVSQLRRSAVSLPSNIAEGHARLSTRDYLRHVSIALGSLAELETQLQLSRELGFASDLVIAEVLLSTSSLGRQVRGLAKSLRRRADEAT
jgi:four helix bundle protein